MPPVSEPPDPGPPDALPGAPSGTPSGKDAEPDRVPGRALLVGEAEAFTPAAPPPDWEPITPRRPPRSAPRPVRDPGAGWRKAVVVLALGGGLTAAVLTQPDVEVAETTTTTLEVGGVGTPAGQEGGPAGATWFCPWVRVEPGYTSRLGIASLAPEQNPGTVQVLPEGTVAAQPFQLPPFSQLTDDPLRGVAAPLASALVETQAGPASVTHAVLATGEAGPAGIASARCRVSDAQVWSVTGGNTELGQEAWLVVVNPFGEDALVSLTASVDDALERPPRWQDFAVGARSAVLIPIHEETPRRSRIGLTLTATQGRITAEYMVLTAVSDPELSTGGVALFEAAPVGEAAWYFAGGASAPDEQELITLYNPGENQALVQVLLRGPEGVLDVPALTEMPIAPQQVTQIIPADYIEPGTPHGLEVLAQNDVYIVASQEVKRAGGWGATAPVNRTSTEWLFADALWPGNAGELAVMNTGTEPATAEIGLLTDGAQVRTIEIPAPAGGVTVVPLPEEFRATGGAVRVQSDVPVVPTLRQNSATGSDLSILMGTPVGG